MSEESLDLRLKSLLNQGRKIEAIKLCKDELQIEYNEAKEYIEEIAKGLTSHVPADIPHESLITQDTKLINEPTEVKEERISPIVNSNINSATTEKNPSDDKISLKSKFIMGLVFIVFLKACSYSTNGGEGYGLTHQFLCKIGDTIIPWPESHRNETERNDEITEHVYSDNSEETEIKETDAVEANTSSPDVEEENNAEIANEPNEVESKDNLQEDVTQDENTTSKERDITIIEVEEQEPGKGEIKLSGGGHRSYGINCTCPLVGWSSKYVVLRRENDNELIIFNRHGDMVRDLRIFSTITNVTVTESRIIVTTNSGKDYYPFQ